MVLNLSAEESGFARYARHGEAGKFNTITAEQK